VLGYELGLVDSLVRDLKLLGDVVKRQEHGNSFIVFLDDGMLVARECKAVRNFFVFISVKDLLFKKL